MFTGWSAVALTALWLADARLLSRVRPREPPPTPPPWIVHCWDGASEGSQESG